MSLNEGEEQLTPQVVQPDEAFEFYLEDFAPGWAGLVEVGVALKTAEGKAGTKWSKCWIVANDRQESTELQKQSIDHLETLKVGDVVGIVTQESGEVHFFVNGSPCGHSLGGAGIHVNNVHGLVRLHQWSSTGNATGSMTMKLSPPDHWDVTGDAARDAVIQVLLNKQSAEYKQIASSFQEDTQNAHIIEKISRLQNMRIYQKYQMTLLGEGEGERMLYHGTTKESLDNIIHHGLNRSYRGANATLYGDGTYFAVSAAYSARETYSRPDSSGLRYILKCRVFVGRYCKGVKHMKEPDLISKASTERYDTAVDDLTHPNIFVTFRDYQAYPEYLIHFRTRVSGNSKVIPHR